MDGRDKPGHDEYRSNSASLSQNNNTASIKDGCMVEFPDGQFVVVSELLHGK
jgi:hypothetical protein